MIKLVYLLEEGAVALFFFSLRYKSGRECMFMTIKIMTYHSDWPQMFNEESDMIRAALGPNCLAVYHIGSTSVPGLAAKPIIDIMPVVKDILMVDQRIKEMETLGYQAKGEYGIPFRRYFQKGLSPRTHNVHVFEEGNPEIHRHLNFRDWMRTHEEDKHAYANLKQELAQQHHSDAMAYCLGKEPFIIGIDAKAGSMELRIMHALTQREWQAVRHFRQHYFFNNLDVGDPYTWTFTHPDHVHFVLLKGTGIVGYAHLQMWPDSRAALRIIVIEEPYRRQGIGRQFLAMCERWLQHQNINSLHIQSSAEAYRFYCLAGYRDMPFDDPDGYPGDARDIDIGKLLS